MGQGLRLGNERRKMGLSQVDIARLITLMGTPLEQARLSQLERGLKPHPDEIQALSGIFDLPPGKLFGEG